MLKSPKEAEYNYYQTIGAQADQSRTLGKELGTVEWPHGASDSWSVKAVFLPWKIQEMADLIK